MRLTDTILFQASLEPERFALVGPGAVVAYGRVAQGMLTAERRLRETGFRAGDRVALSITNPLDHIVLCLALHRAQMTAVHFGQTAAGAADLGAVGGFLSDVPNVQFSLKHPGARNVIIDQGWLQGQDQVVAAARASAHREPSFVSEVTAAGATTSAELDVQLEAALLAAPADWERLLCLHPPQSAAARRHVFMALAMGRTACFADVANARQLASAYRHHYLVGPCGDLVQLANRQSEHFIPIPSLRGLLAEAPEVPPVAASSQICRLSPNGRFAWSDAAIGMVALAELSDLAQRPAKRGAVGPWAQIRLSANVIEVRLRGDAAGLAAPQWRSTNLPPHLAG